MFGYDGMTPPCWHTHTFSRTIARASTVRTRGLCIFFTGGEGRKEGDLLVCGHRPLVVTCHQMCPKRADAAAATAVAAAAPGGARAGVSVNAGGREGVEHADGRGACRAPLIGAPSAGGALCPRLPGTRARHSSAASRDELLRRPGSLGGGGGGFHRSASRREVSSCPGGCFSCGRAAGVHIVHRTPPQVPRREVAPVPIPISIPTLVPVPDLREGYRH